MQSGCGELVQVYDWQLQHGLETVALHPLDSPCFRCTILLAGATGSLAGPVGCMLVVSWPHGDIISFMQRPRFDELYRLAAMHLREAGTSTASLSQLYRTVLHEYAAKDARASRPGLDHSDAASLAAETDAMLPAVVAVLERLEDLDMTYVQQNISWLLPALASLTSCRNEGVRLALQRVMLTKVTPIVIGIVATVSPPQPV